MGTIIEKHQVAGLDERERGFNRLVELEQSPEGYGVTFRYETTVVQTGRHPSPREAVLALIAELQARGFSELRSRISFRGETYLGSQELWEEYPTHADDHPEAPSGLLARLVAWFRSRSLEARG